jgi:hypothetical protein
MSPDISLYYTLSGLQRARQIDPWLGSRPIANEGKPDQSNIYINVVNIETPKEDPIQPSVSTKQNYKTNSGKFFK